MLVLVRTMFRVGQCKMPNRLRLQIDALIVRGGQAGRE